MPSLAGYPAAEPDRANFLFEWDRSPVLVMMRLLWEGGPMDPWLWRLWHGWPHFPGQPLTVVAIGALWALLVAGCLVALCRQIQTLERGVTNSSELG